MINGFKYGQSWRIWPSPLSLSLYSTLKNIYTIKKVLFLKTRAKYLRYKLVVFLHCKVTSFHLLTWNFTKRGTPLQIFFKDFTEILKTPFSATSLRRCFQNSLPDISNILLRFVKASAIFINSSSWFRQKKIKYKMSNINIKTRC